LINIYSFFISAKFTEKILLGALATLVAILGSHFYILAGRGGKGAWLVVKRMF
jgi:hypothetical protein